MAPACTTLTITGANPETLTVMVAVLGIKEVFSE